MHNNHRMKRFLIIMASGISAVALFSCGGPDRSPGRSYMPDMTYSVAYETYSPYDERLKESGAHYTALPVGGTIARGDVAGYALMNDSAGAIQAASVKNPLVADAINMKEAERLYLVNCAICHGAKLDGNGPLYKGGDGPYIAKPATLVGDAKYETMAEGTMFHSVTYGKNAMGSYASQLTTNQRWMVITYIKAKQASAKKPAAAATTDSTAVAMTTN